MPRSEFNVHVLNEEGLKKAADVGEIFSEALTKIEALMPVGPIAPRERAIVVTKMQEAAFFAKRAVAIEPANHQ